MVFWPAYVRCKERKDKMGRKQITQPLLSARITPTLHRNDWMDRWADRENQTQCNIFDAFTPIKVVFLGINWLYSQVQKVERRPRKYMHPLK